MTSAGGARVLSEPLGGSALSQAVQRGELPTELQPFRPTTHSEWRDHAGKVRRGASPRWLEQLRPAFSPSGRAAERLERVAAEQGIVVTTGQQAGLFGGPLYTLAKALSALGLADALERELGIPAAPVFWAATDDADFLEASVIHVAHADGLLELRSQAAPPAGTPMAAAPLGDVTPLLEQLRAACGSASHASYFEAARAAYRPDATVGGAYVELLRALLEPLGIAVMDSSHPAYLSTARETMTRALQRAPELAHATSANADAIRALGFEPQVVDDRGLALVFLADGSTKRRLSVDEARALGQGGAPASATLSPNVLLRPVVERALLPTVAYVAGPGELAYFAQVKVVASVLDLPAPVAVPRWSGTVIEPFAARALQRLQVSAEEVRDVHALERRLAVEALPDGVSSAWKRVGDDLHAALTSLDRAVAEVQLVPPAVLEGLRRSLTHRLARAERRLLAAMKRRNESVRRDLTVARDALYPLGKRQERVLNFIPMLTRHGETLLNDLTAAAAAHAASLVASPRTTKTAR